MVVDAPHSTSTMDLSAILDEPVPEVPRRSSSNAHSIAAPSPTVSAAKLPTPPLSVRQPMKRKRHDPKPIWAVLEKDVPEGEPFLPPDQLQKLQQSRAPPLPTRSHPPSAPVHANGPAPAIGPPTLPSSGGLTGFERPVTDDAHVYDELSRSVCDFIWEEVVENQTLRAAIAESPGIEVEIEARWGQVVDTHSNMRLTGMHRSECVVAADGCKFESTMSLEQHKRMNQFLNSQVAKSKDPKSMRAEVNYKHTKEIDEFFQLDQAGFDLLPPVTRQILAAGGARQRIRVTRDWKTGEVIRALIKHRISNMEISSPKTEWDYRIGINLEIQYPGLVEGLKPVVENGRTVESMRRKKDRVSYSWLSAYQIDLTQVTQTEKAANHELELELDGKMVLEAADNIKRNLPNNYEPLVAGMMNNLRVLSREITPQGS